ncbi:Bifunctional thiamine biosynthesis protein ThiDN [Candidatus Methanobinarius endosymbioticus]|uniref:Bifunctional thiamine biosynthesis protein ThiDN n=1 Tax=Candidatus Methanobinarius endosymbioticus TaxID=2006182 RepID=A0A366MFT3_9EURY|nr:Bifunctional thiamine biosynthesis protein ThiDN [Candidatus Methanobinarius endosymbioticus]
MMGISIAGFDPSGGAGIIADMKIFAALGIHGTSAITALTTQNPNKVFSLMPIDINYIKEQIDSIFDAYSEYINYGKTGMLYSKEIIKAVAKKVKEYDINIVIDPVMVASAGGSLLEEKNEIEQVKEEISKALKKYLLPQCLIVTPNISEAEILSNIEINNEEDAMEAACQIGKISNVIITGGHLNGINTIFNKKTNQIKTIKKTLFETKNVHGSGCSFSAALTGYMIKKSDLNISIEKSLDFIENSIKNGEYGTLKQTYTFD